MHRQHVPHCTVNLWKVEFTRLLLISRYDKIGWTYIKNLFFLGCGAVLVSRRLYIVRLELWSEESEYFFEMYLLCM
jgi:hypothetical protein